MKRQSAKDKVPQIRVTRIRMALEFGQSRRMQGCEAGANLGTGRNQMKRAYVSDVMKLLVFY